MDVRTVWGQIIAQNKGLNLKKKSDDSKRLSNEIDELVEDFKKKDNRNAQNRQEQIRQLLTKYVIQ